jgi:C1A family cysteine protease
MLYLFALVSVAVSIPTFDEWMIKYEKTEYALDPEKLGYRRRVYEETVAEIEAINAMNTTWTAGVNAYSDLTWAEFKAYFNLDTGLDPQHCSATGRNGRSLPPSKIPDSVDWRTKGMVTKVKNQGSCGSCWAFSATESIESEAFLSGKYSLEVLAPQQIVSCDKKSSGCNGGDPATAFTYIKANGMEKEADYPYTAKDGSCKFNSAKVAVKISGQKTVSGGESGMLTALQGRPLSVCHQTGGWQHYSGGVMTSCSSGGGHCTQMVGYASSGDYWIVKNSWGTSWGNSGYLYLKKGSDLCGISKHCLYPTI